MKLNELTDCEIEEVGEIITNLAESFDYLKRFIKDNDSHLYNRWRAGGFMVSNEFISSYPNLMDIMSELDDQLIEINNDEDEDE